MRLLCPPHPVLSVPCISSSYTCLLWQWPWWGWEWCDSCCLVIRYIWRVRGKKTQQWFWDSKVGGIRGDTLSRKAKVRWGNLLEREHEDAVYNHCYCEIPSLCTRSVPCFLPFYRIKLAKPQSWLNSTLMALLLPAAEHGWEKHTTLNACAPLSNRSLP